MQDLDPSFKKDRDDNFPTSSYVVLFQMKKLPEEGELFLKDETISNKEIVAVVIWLPSF
ncbi:MAG: hypothetical protein ACOYBE_03265 [Blautia sp.]|jgi:hypothetical protein